MINQVLIYSARCTNLCRKKINHEIYLKILYSIYSPLRELNKIGFYSERKVEKIVKRKEKH